MFKIISSIFVFSASVSLSAQNYTSFFTGNPNDSVAQAQGGVCLAGGATEDDNAMIWFLNRASGGDVLVLRASGSDGYNDYFFAQLGVELNSVETIRFESASASNDAYILNRIAKAEAIWFAGGDQWDYISYWRNSPVAEAINEAINQRNIVVGGTSAGMAILGSHYFSAEVGSVTSETALSNPYNSNVTPDGTPFLQVPFLSNVITDTHYDNPDRRGRHVVFLARILTDTGVEARGIACEEYTHVCIDEFGIAKVYGSYPEYDDMAYFIQVNCELSNPLPEVCTQGSPLTWNFGGEALLVYEVQGTPEAMNTFDLNDWHSGSGGIWKNWFVENGAISFSSEISAPNCNISGFSNQKKELLEVSPNPVLDFATFHFGIEEPIEIKVFAIDGRLVKSIPINESPDDYTVDVSNLDFGIYNLTCAFKSGRVGRLTLIKN